MEKKKFNKSNFTLQSLWSRKIKEIYTSSERHKLYRKGRRICKSYWTIRSREIDIIEKFSWSCSSKSWRNHL